MRRTDILEKREDILKWIQEEKSKSYIAEQLNCKPETLNSYLSKMGIEYKGQPNKKRQQEGSSRYKPAMYYIENNVPIRSSLLREKLIRDGLKEDKCEICGITTWQGVHLPLELHHKNGNHYDNSLENLQILCPNCHSIQEGNSGKAIKKIVLPSKQKFCIDCGKLIDQRATRCKSCAAKLKNRKVERPSREKLKEEVRKESFTRLANKYGVSDKTISKWCVAYNFPSKKREIMKYTEEEWQKF